ncbi:hypothetical protein [Morganella morganii]|uniref:hypothetical protein n=1 Tax=Morganella morganii TaxID=582 RepID=UPI003314FA19
MGNKQNIRAALTVAFQQGHNNAFSVISAVNPDELEKSRQIIAGLLGTGASFRETRKVLQTLYSDRQSALSEQT